MADILVVDDAEFIRTLLVDILSDNGHHVIGEATNGNEAVTKYIELKPDLVTMNIIMPKCTGIDALKSIKAKDPNACIVMISALSQRKLIMESMSAGAKDFIVKPFDEKTVVEVINKALL